MDVSGVGYREEAPRLQPFASFSVVEDPRFAKAGLRTFWGPKIVTNTILGLLMKPYLDPKEPTLFKDLYKEIIIRSPKKAGSLGSR